MTASDWDGAALGHPNDDKFPEEFCKVYNTFMDGAKGIEEKQALMKAEDQYLATLQGQIKAKQHAGGDLNDFEEKVLKVENMDEVMRGRESLLPRAGCITPFEFVTNQLANYFYKDPNLENPFQHGYDMRNPYGSNLDGAWVMMVKGADGTTQTIYGQNQEQLIAAMLSEGFLERNRIDINFGADMSAGWDIVIEKQLQIYGQAKIPPQTLGAYEAYQNIKRLQEGKPNANDKTTAQLILDFDKHQQPIPSELIHAYFAQHKKAFENLQHPDNAEQLAVLSKLITNHTEISN